MFAWTTTCVTTHRFALSEAMPVADFAVEQGDGQGAQAVRDSFVRHGGFDLLGQLGEVSLTGADLRDHRLELAAHKVSALRAQAFPPPRSGPASGQRLMLELDAQGPAVVVQPAHLALPKL